MITPQEARALRDGALPGPWERRQCGERHGYGGAPLCGAEIAGPIHAEFIDASTVDLVAAAPELAEVVANLRYEYAVQVLLSDGAGGNVWHFADEDSLPFGSLKPYEVRWYTEKEAQEILDAEVDYFGHDGIRIVPRLVSEPEVTH